MKKKLVLVLTALLIGVLLLLFLPIPLGQYDDGGTREYRALTYKIIVWNRLYASVSPDGSADTVGRYKKTAVYWFSDARKDMAELWRTEAASPDFFDFIVPQA